MNAGSNYSFKVALPLTDWRFFFYTGADGLFGLSIPTSAAESLSFGAGTRMFTIEGEVHGGRGDASCSPMTSSSRRASSGIATNP